MLQKWLKRFDKKQEQPSPAPVTGLTWSAEASQALELALKQAPVPAMLKGKVRKELEKAAEDTARSAGHSEVGAEDLVNGMMAKLPPHLQKQAQDMIKKKMEEEGE